MAKNKSDNDDLKLANRLLKRMMDVIFEEKDIIPMNLMIYLASQFSARVLIGVPKTMGVSQADVLNDYMLLVRKTINQMKSDGTFKSFDNEIERLERAEYAKKAIEEFKKKQAALGEELEPNPVDDDTEELAN
jgi:hypothetical protein